jgi:aldehyde:ferredoxin oxidoreductase
MLKDSLSLDDQMFPRIYSRRTEDGFAQVAGVEGPDFEHRLFTLATGSTLSPEELDLACEHAFNLERAIQVRNFGRNREMDETVIPHFARMENWANPLTRERQGLDAERFRQLLDEYYRLRGWDPADGRPTHGTLRRLDLADIADQRQAADHTRSPEAA